MDVIPAFAGIQVIVVRASCLHPTYLDMLGVDSVDQVIVVQASCLHPIPNGLPVNSRG